LPGSRKRHARGRDVPRYFSNHGPPPESLGSCGGGAAVGAILGHQIDDSKGKVVGAILGAAAGTAVAAKTGKEIELPAGTLVSIQIEEDVEIPRAM